MSDNVPTRPATTATGFAIRVSPAMPVLPLD
jgi:hypothetical protein